VFKGEVSDLLEQVRDRRRGRVMSSAARRAESGFRMPMADWEEFAYDEPGDGPTMMLRARIDVPAAAIDGYLY